MIERNLISWSFLKWMCCTKILLKSFVDSNKNEYLFVVHNLTLKFFRNLLCSWTPCVLLTQPQLLRNHFLVSLPKKQQDDMVQPFGHFQWSLRGQSPGYDMFQESWICLWWQWLPTSNFHLMEATIQFELIVIYECSALQ